MPLSLLQTWYPPSSDKPEGAEGEPGHFGAAPQLSWLQGALMLSPMAKAAAAAEGHQAPVACQRGAPAGPLLLKPKTGAALTAARTPCSATAGWKTSSNLIEQRGQG